MGVRVRISESAAEEIRQLERIACASWPALEQTLLDGWILGSSGSYTRRANSVSAFAASALGLAARVAEVEAHYAARGLAAVFKMTAAAQPGELDAFLKARGYERHSETIVMVLPDLCQAPSAPSAPSALSALDANGAAEGSFQLLGGRSREAWLTASCAFSRVADQNRLDYEAILERLSTRELECIFGAWVVDAKIQSVALAVICEGITSFHQVATDPEVRGRRYAERVLRELLALSEGQGAESAMLSVEADNASARRLYDRLGFSEIYRYWYRER